jgi:hypothetical protein
MKLHIDVEQLNELSDKAKEKLREWWKPEEGDLVIFLQDNNHFDKETFVVGTGTFLTDKGWGVNYEDQAGLMPKENVYPLLSIGQMIELIDENDVGEWGIHNQAGDGWTISSNNLYAPQYYIPQHGTDSDSVCDCLWEAVKYILEND